MLRVSGQMRWVAAAVALVATAGAAVDATLQAKTPVKTPNSTSHPAHTNRLAQEKSPYLLQHAHNPVDWYPWGKEALARAKRENKPIFLSIGYSTCHWCHVMERESFEDETVARFLNEHFINIKVDREERPDVDQIYMSFVQAMTGQGGWPLNVFLTPDLKPFYGGTYWPPEPRFGRPSFLQVVQQVAKAWRERGQQLSASADEMHRRMMELVGRQPAADLKLTEEVLRQAAIALKQGYDAVHGGWGQAPKFPSPSQPAFLLRRATRESDTEAIQMVLHTCRHMARGGIHDHIGGGFHRYSVDEKWLVPHFEKMLYDNAQLAQLYLDAYLVSGDRALAEVVRDILQYVLRDMTHPQGGFYSAEDADSEGKEGKFYCWTLEELKQCLKPDELRVAVEYFGITEQGNFIDHSDPDPLPNLNVLSIVKPELEQTQGRLLRSIREKLLRVRSKRVRPHRDDKILASWNGLMLGALARAYAALDDEAWRQAAEKNLAFLQDNLWESDQKRLHHRWRDGARDEVQLLEDYAFLLDGVIELYQATLEPRHLQFAIDLAEGMLQRFYDPTHGGFWQSAGADDELILRVKDDYDGALPSGNSVATLALLKLAALTDRKSFREAANKTLRLFADRLHQLPQAMPYMLSALQFALDEPYRVVVAADDSNSATARRLVRAAASVYQPHKVILGTQGPVEPFARTLKPKDGKAVVYLCTGSACQAPTSDPAKVKELLKPLRASLSESTTSARTQKD